MCRRIRLGEQNQRKTEETEATEITSFGLWNLSRFPIIIFKLAAANYLRFCVELNILTKEN